MSTSEKFPLQNKQAAITIDGIHTEILLTGFADKIFVVITQYGKIGSLVMTRFYLDRFSKYKLMIDCRSKLLWTCHRF